MKTDTQLKAYFETNDTPTAAQFGELIDFKRHVADGYTYEGVAIPSTLPTVIKYSNFFIAFTAGTYTNFGSLVVADGEVAILKGTVSKTDGSIAWSKDTIIASVTVYGVNICTALGESGANAIDLICDTPLTTPTYQWQSKSTTADAWVNITGETAQTLTFESDSTIFNSLNYVLIRCVVTSNTNTYNSNAIACVTTGTGLN